MAQAGQFRLVLQSGTQDNYLTEYKAFDDLVSLISKKQNKTWTKDIWEIDEQFTTFVSGTYKPFMSVGYAYSSSMTREGSCSLGHTITFKINNFGDLLNDMVLHVKLTGLAAISALDKVRYCALPGHKLLKNVGFYINDNLIMEYTADYTNAYYNCNILKKENWLKCVGQEIPTIGYTTPDPSTDEYKIGYPVYSGAQTFKRTHPTLEMWIPMLFPFREVRNALPIISIPHGQTYVKIKLCDPVDLVSYADYGGGGAYTDPTIETIELYQNQIYLPQNIHHIFLKAGVILLRKMFVQKVIETKSSDAILLHEIKFPVESLYVGFCPLANTVRTQSWYKNKSITDTSVPIPVVVSGAAMAGTLYYELEEDPVTSVGLKTHGDIWLYSKTSPSFYENYLPVRFMPSIYTSGWYCFMFNFYPDKYDPSGHVNFSISREMRLEYDSTSISRANETYCIVIANALSFLVLKDFSAVLRYCV